MASLPIVSATQGDSFLFDDFANGHPRHEGGNPEGTRWRGMAAWTLNNVDSSTVWFPSNSVARFSNFRFSWSPAVSIISNGQWAVQTRLVLLLRVRAWNFTNMIGSYAWRTGFDWGTGRVLLGYGADYVQSIGPLSGIHLNAECNSQVLQGFSIAQPASLLGKWVTANLTLSGATQNSIVFSSIYDSEGALLFQTGGVCGAVFGSLPARVAFFTSFGVADVDWITLTS